MVERVFNAIAVAFDGVWTFWSKRMVRHPLATPAVSKLFKGRNTRSCNTDENSETDRYPAAAPRSLLTSTQARSTNRGYLGMPHIKVRHTPAVVAVTVLTATLLGGTSDITAPVLSDALPRVITAAAIATEVPPGPSEIVTSASGRTITVHGTAFCKMYGGNVGPCDSVTLSGNGYEDTQYPAGGGLFDPNTATFTFSNVPVAAMPDLSTATFTITTTASTASAGNPTLDNCPQTINIQGAFVPGDSFGLGWGNNGSGPWSRSGACGPN